MKQGAVLLIAGLAIGGCSEIGAPFDDLPELPKTPGSGDIERVVDDYAYDFTIHQITCVNVGNKESDCRFEVRTAKDPISSNACQLRMVVTADDHFAYWGERILLDAETGLYRPGLNCEEPLGSLKE